MMVALAARPPLWVAAAAGRAFAIFHGHAHGAELPPGADAVAYSVGFVVATGLLHLAGIAFGLLARWPRRAVRRARGRRCDRARRRCLPERHGMSRRLPAECCNPLMRARACPGAAGPRPAHRPATAGRRIVSLRRVRHRACRGSRGDRVRRRADTRRRRPAGATAFASGPWSRWPSRLPALACAATRRGSRASRSASTRRRRRFRIADATATLVGTGLGACLALVVIVCRHALSHGVREWQGASACASSARGSRPARFWCWRCASPAGMLDLWCGEGATSAGLRGGLGVFAAPRARSPARDIRAPARPAPRSGRRR